MAETLAQDATAADDDAPLDAGAIRSRLERLALLRRWEEDAEEEVASVAAEEDVVRRLRSEDQCLQEVDAWVSSAPAMESDGFDAFMEWLRKEVSLVEEENHKLPTEICSIADKTVKDMIQLDADIAALESSLKKIDSESLKHLEASHTAELPVATDSCRDQTNFDKDYKYEVLERDHQLEKNENYLKLLENQNNSIQRAEAMWELESMLSEAKVLDFKDNCLSVFLKAPVLTHECLMYGQELDCSVNSFVSDHELLIEVDEESMEPKKVQIFPDDTCVDILIDKLKASRDIISTTPLGWLIRQFQHHIIINSLRHSLVNDASNARRSFEYFDKDGTIVAHLACGIDAFFKISADWPLSSYGLKLISVQNSGAQSTDITLSLICKTKELANGLELQTRRHLVKFVDAVEDILLREMRPQLHSSSMS
ncbi:hypothetical protein E2562_017686 [Oryza meyeriana var. granulata]|uniref:Uncharacterized protein n=1 Tax=Oryza meyeriana var. granulata TaxID=110450 RepID=A0A6G1BWJ5_9ORYZ|nr:hypothetical protein E2562_017686 [Oryza meyeriana var. granulata]